MNNCVDFDSQILSDSIDGFVDLILQLNIGFFLLGLLIGFFCGFYVVTWAIGQINKDRVKDAYIISKLSDFKHEKL